MVTGLVPCATHQIAALAFATMLRRGGLRVTYLGPDLPVQSWVEAVRTTRPDAVVVGAPRADDRPAATRVVNALHETTSDTVVYVGGQGAEPEQALVGTTLAEASAWLAAKLSRS